MNPPCFAHPGDEDDDAPCEKIFDKTQTKNANEAYRHQPQTKSENRKPDGDFPFRQQGKRHSDGERCDSLTAVGGTT